MRKYRLMEVLMEVLMVHMVVFHRLMVVVVRRMVMVVMVVECNSRFSVCVKNMLKQISMGKLLIVVLGVFIVLVAGVCLLPKNQQPIKNQKQATPPHTYALSHSVTDSLLANNQQFATARQAYAAGDFQTALTEYQNALKFALNDDQKNSIQIQIAVVQAALREYPESISGTQGGCGRHFGHLSSAGVCHYGNGVFVS